MSLNSIVFDLMIIKIHGVSYFFDFQFKNFHFRLKNKCDFGVLCLFIPVIYGFKRFYFLYINYHFRSEKCAVSWC